MKGKKGRITITLSKILIKKIDRLRDDLPRSRFIEKMLISALRRFER